MLSIQLVVVNSIAIHTKIFFEEELEGAHLRFAAAHVSLTCPHISIYDT